MSCLLPLLARSPDRPFGADDVKSVRTLQGPRGASGQTVQRILLHDGRRFILKTPCEASEVRATRLAAQLGVAPSTWALGEGAFLQDFLPGAPLAQRWRAGTAPAALGAALAGMLQALHGAGLCYVDTLARHLHRHPQGGWRLIDYGTALVLDDPQGPRAEVEAWLRNSPQSRARTAGATGSLAHLARLHDWRVWRDELRDARRPLMWPAARRAAVAAFEAVYPRPAESEN